MPTTVRLPLRVEQALASYCLDHQRTKSEVIIEVLSQRLLGEASTAASSFDQAKASSFVGCVEGAPDLSINIKTSVKEKLRAKHSR